MTSFLSVGIHEVSFRPPMLICTRYEFCKEPADEMWYVTGLSLEVPRDIPGIGAKIFFKDNLYFKAHFM